MLNICVVLPSVAAFNQAGARIRYHRLIEPLRRQDVNLTLRAIEQLQSGDVGQHDIYLISKVYDARAMVLAYEARAKGCHVGMDLFDNYFSDSDDTRLLYQRRWLRRMFKLATFSVTSTPAMQEVARSSAPEKPTFILNDPFGAFDSDRVGRSAAAKVAQARIDRKVRLGWFGIASNPLFSVGLADVIAFSSHIAECERSGFALELDILTDTRSLTVPLLEGLRTLPIPYRIVEWSRAAEISLLNRVIACIVPVNAQPFSTAKSLNRAVTSLAGGTQVVSIGYPLYRRLDPFIYDDLSSLVRDIADDRLRLRSETSEQLGALLKEEADPEQEAGRLATSLRDLPPSKRIRRVGPGVMLHGKVTGKAIHTFARQMGRMSVGSPFSPRTLNYDVTFSLDAEEGGMRAKLNARALKRADLPYLDANGRVDDESARLNIPLSGLVPAMIRSAGSSPSADLAAYSMIMDACALALAEMFPSSHQIVSEEDRSLQATRKGRSTTNEAGDGTTEKMKVSA